MSSTARAARLTPWLVALLFLALPSTGRAQDKLVLKNGEILLGSVVEEGEDWILFRTGRSELRLPSTLIDTVERAAPPAEAERSPSPAAAPPPTVAERNVWFAVHDLEGRLVGCCHRMIRSESKDDVPLLRLEEQWVFGQGEERLHLHHLEYVHPDLEPHSFQFREWREMDGTALEGTVRGTTLEVFHTNRKGQRSRRELPFPTGSAFPMAAALGLRRESPGAREERVLSVFDPRRGTLVEQRYELGMRRTTKPGVDARVIATLRGATASEEWIDGAGDVLRFEVNGPWLVATPARGTDLQRWIAGDSGRSLDVPGIVGGGGSFRVRLPNPSWTHVEEPGDEPGAVLLRRDDEDAHAAFLEVRGLDPDLTEQGAVLAYEKRLESVDGYARRALPRAFQRGSKRGMRLEFSYRDDRGRKREAVVHLVRTRARHLAFLASTPAGGLAGLERDLDRLLHLLELD